MAKKRFFGRKARTRTVTKYRRSRRSESSDLGPKLLGAAAYGAGRGWMSSMILPLTSRLGTLGGYADTAGMGIVDYLLYKNVRMPLVKNAALAGLQFEVAVSAARATAGMAAGNGNSGAW